jgi:hypothetical protein
VQPNVIEYEFGNKEWVPDLPSKPAVQRWLGQPLKELLLLPTSEWLFFILFVFLGQMLSIKPAVQRWLGQPLKVLLLPTSEWLSVMLCYSSARLGYTGKCASASSGPAAQHWLAHPFKALLLPTVSEQNNGCLFAIHWIRAVNRTASVHGAA